MFETFKKLFESRKVQLSIIMVVSSSIVWVGGKLGLGLSTEVVAPVAGAIVAALLSVIFGIAMEDAAAKGAGMAPVQPAKSGEVGAISVSPQADTNIGAVMGNVEQNAAAPATSVQP